MKKRLELVVAVTLAALLAGGALGYLIKAGQSKPEYTLVSRETLQQVLGDIRTEKPSAYQVLNLDARTARTDEEVAIAGNSIFVERYEGLVDFSIRLNELDAQPIPLSQIGTISGPFYRLFITNPAGSGYARLIIGRSIKFEPKPLDLSDLANRIIFNVPSIDTKGRLIWADDFEGSTLKWYTETSGAGGSVALSTDHSYSGDKSVKLTAGNNVSVYALIRRKLSLPSAGRLGFESSIHDSTGGGSETGIHTILSFIVRDGSFAYSAQIKYWLGLPPEISSPSGVQWWDGSSWQNIGVSREIYPSDYRFDPVKLVLDTNRQKYARLSIGSESWDLSEKSLPKAADTSAPEAQIEIKFVGLSASNYYEYVDNVLVTRDEP